MEICCMNVEAITIGFIILFFLWWNLAISVKIVDYLQKYHRDISLSNYGFFVRGKIFKYLPLYKKTTLEREGKVGPLYFSFYATFFMAMICLAMGIAMVA